MKHLFLMSSLDCSRFAAHATFGRLRGGTLEMALSAVGILDEPVDNFVGLMFYGPSQII